MNPQSIENKAGAVKARKRAGFFMSGVFLPALLMFCLLFLVQFLHLLFHEGGHALYRLLRGVPTILGILGLLFSGAANIVIIGPSLLLGLFESAQMQLALVFLGVPCGFLVPYFHLVMGYAIEDQ